VGLVSFLSPCVLPLVPGYLSAVSGVSVEDLGDRAPGSRSRVLGPAVLFCLSFTVVFVALGMSATGIGSALRDHQETLNTIAGWLIIALGTFMIAVLFAPRLGRDVRPDSLIRRAGTGGPVIAGLAFAIAWTPCVGPTLGAILAAASTSDTVGKGGLLLAFYAAGLAVPFLLTAVAFDRATNAFTFLRRHHRAITVVSGLILIAMGALIVTGELTRLNADAQRLLEDLGLDWLYRL
jgi:cytochrome c-type biogenesis protein